MLILFTMLTSLLLLCGCAGKSSGEKKTTTPTTAISEPTPGWEPVKEIPYTLVVSVDMIRELGYMFARTRSKKAEVLVKPGVNPLTYIPSPEDEQTVLAADVFLYMGLDLEPGLAPLLARVQHKVRCIALTEELDKNLLLKSDKYPGGYDPHIWWGLDVWEKFLLIVVRTFVEIDPEGEFAYATTYQRYGESTSLMNVRFYQTWLSAIPGERRFLVTLHPAYEYLGRLYGFTVRSILDPGQDTYSAARINELADFIIAHQVPVIFPEVTYPREPLVALQAVAAEKGYEVAIGPELYSYFLDQDMANKNYTFLTAARTMGRIIYDTLKTKDLPGMPD